MQDLEETICTLPAHVIAALYTALDTTPATTANMAQSVGACVKPRIGSPLSEPRKLQTRPAAELLSTSSGQERRRMR